MPLNTAGINAFLEDGNEAVVYVAIGSGTGSGTENSAARHALASSVASGVITATGVPYAFTGTPGAAATNALFFSALTAGTFYGNNPLDGDQTYNASGAYNITGLTVTGSSSDL